jgi:pimeloyl-ACP methyl ester carboxylesterase
VDLLNTVQGLVRRGLQALGVHSELHRIDGVVVHAYRVAGTGDGPPVVLVHGLAGSANGFLRILRPLARRFSTVYALDFPGNGFSPLPATGPLDLRAQLEVLHGFLRDVVGAPAFVVGNSLGGALALMLAGEHPEDVAALGLVAPAGARLSPRGYSELMAVLDLRSNADAVRLTRTLFHRPPRLAPLLARGMRRMHAAPAVRAIRNGTRPNDHVPVEILARLRAPVLVLWGGSEKLLPPEMLAWYRANLPRSAQIDVVEGFGHVPQVERPRELVDRLTRFATEAGLARKRAPTGVS